MLTTDPRFDLWANWEAERARLTLYQRQRANVCGCSRCNDHDRADELDVLIRKSQELMGDVSRLHPRPHRRRHPWPVTKP